MLCFGFEGGQYLCVSVETRKTHASGRAWATPFPERPPRPDEKSRRASAGSRADRHITLWGTGQG